MDNVDALRHRGTTRRMVEVSGASCINQRSGAARGLHALAANGNFFSRLVPHRSKDRQGPAELESWYANLVRPFPNCDAGGSISQSATRRRKSFIGDVC